MAKLESYDWKNLPPDLVEFIEDLTEYWNTGRVPLQQAAAPPTATTFADGPSIHVAKDGATWYLYVYTNSTDGWKRVALSALA